MKIIKTISFVLLISLGFSIESKQITSFKDYFKSPAVLMDNYHLCIWDQPERRIHVFSLKDFKEISKFGRKGQGPGEFIAISSVTMNKDKIYVNSFPKLCIFNKEGILIEEIKNSDNGGNFIPTGNNFVGMSYPYTNIKEKKIKILFSLYNNRLKKIKDIFLSGFRKMSFPGKNKEIAYIDINDCVKAVSYKDNIYIGATDKRFFFVVFDYKGNKLYEILINSREEKVADNEKKRILEKFKTNMGESHWREFKMHYECKVRDFYPSFANFSINDDKIYVFKYPKNEVQDILILNLKGKILKRKRIPRFEVNNIINLGRYYVNNGNIYYMLENEDSNEWELHEIKID